MERTHSLDGAAKGLVIVRNGDTVIERPQDGPGQELIWDADSCCAAKPLRKAAGRREAKPQMKKIIAAVIVALAVAPEAKAEKKLVDHFSALFGKFGQNSTTKVKIVSGPKDVKMRNGGVPGKQWIATCGKFRFKLTIQLSTKVKVEQLVQILQKLPMPYMRACEVVSDETEDGIAIYANLGGAAAHGGKSYINLVPRANALVIAHEAGHTLEQAARESDPKILDKWEEAIKADKVSVSKYGDRVRHEDLGDFAKVYAVCLDAGAEHLARLKKLSPARFALWEEILTAPPAGWPQWRGPNRDGKSPDKGLLKSWPADGPKLMWKVTRIGQGFSNVSIGGGLIYTTGRKEAGNPPKVPESSNVYNRPGKRLFMTAIDMQGKVKWDKDITAAYVDKYPGSRATPTYDNGNLYLLAGTGVLGCYDAKTGDTKWQRDMKEFGAEKVRWGFAESVLILGDLVTASPGGECFMVALNKDTGKTVWKSGAFGGAHYSSPIHVVYKGAEMIINGAGKGLVGIHAKTGKILWTNEFASGNLANVPTPAFEDGYVFWAVGYGKGGICLKLSVSGQKVTAKEVWRTEDIRTQYGGYVILDGYIYGNNMYKWSCVDLKTGKTMWKGEGVRKGSITYADGMLYLYGIDKGQIALAPASPKGLELVGNFNVAGKGPSRAPPVVAGGRLYLRYDENLYCFDVRAQ